MVERGLKWIEEKKILQIHPCYLMTLVWSYDIREELCLDVWTNNVKKGLNQDILAEWAKDRQIHFNPVYQISINWKNISVLPSK